MLTYNYFAFNYLKKKYLPMEIISKPADGYASFYQKYMDNVPNDGRLLRHLSEIMLETEQVVFSLSENQLAYKYRDDKWTIKDILVHLCDCERIFIYRATRIARGDSTDLPGFEEKLFALNADANNRTVSDIIKELKAFRTSSIIFVETLDENALNRAGTANGYLMTVKLLVNHIYGHHRHHLNIIHQRYLQ